MPRRILDHFAAIIQHQDDLKHALIVSVIGDHVDGMPDLGYLGFEMRKLSVSLRNFRQGFSCLTGQSTAI